MFRLLPVPLAAVFLTVLVRADPTPNPTTTVVRLAVSADTKPPPRALKYVLLPEPRDLTPGNAAPQWLRAGHAAVSGGHKITAEEHELLSADRPVKDLPRAQARKFLGHFRAALTLADRAARFDSCDWALPALTFQNLDDLPLAELQALRQLASLLSLRCRLELSDGDLDKAVRTLQTGLALGKHLGEGTTLIQHLIGVGIVAQMLARVEDLMQTPGAPNLYWALTALPRSLVSGRRATLHELDALYRSVPGLRRLEKETLSPRQAEELLEELLKALSQCGMEGPGWQGKLAFGALAARVYPDGKQALIAQGRGKEQVEALPALQVVLLYYLGQYDRARDDLVKWLSVPSWQARAGLERIEKDVQAASTRDGNLLIKMLFPTVLRAHQAGLRVERQLAALRCVEALRLHGAGHDGQLPARLDKVRAVPLPTDPVTGKGFDALYRRDGERAVLDVPAVTGQPAVTGRRYELSPSR
jgi:tetratricopeptide (TPR) repeat protein